MNKLLVLLLSLIIFQVLGSNPKYTDFKDNKVRYKADWGYCPSRTTGKLILHLTEKFEENRSLIHLKNYIEEQKLKDKYFFHEYKVAYNPISKILDFKLKCSEPIIHVKVYTPGYDQSYYVLLTKDANLYDPDYEILLREEGKIKGELPTLVLNFDEVSDTKKLFKLVSFLESFKESLFHNISEIIIDENREMTMIFSFNQVASSVFMGSDQWELKLDRLTRIYDHLNSKKQIPSIVNLTNLKKIVVKFADKI